MQAEGIRKGDRLDVYDDRGRVNGGWTATANAVVGDGFAYIPVKKHDGGEDTLVQPVGTQIPITWGAGNG